MSQGDAVQYGGRPGILATAKRLRTGDVSASALADEALDRILANGCAFLTVDADGARAAAAHSDTLLARGEPRSLLEGLPVSIKDLFDIKGQVTLAGSTPKRGLPVAPADAAVVALLRAAGAVLVGRTHMSEFAFTGLGDNPHYPRCSNPADASRVPGGSSSGAAVSVATGQSIMGLGTDTGGSVRIPASFCSLVGFKPTQSRVPREGAFVLSPTQDSIGPLANTVLCCAIADAVLSGSGDVLPVQRPVKGLRLAVPTEFVMAQLDEPVATCFDASLRTLQDAGAIIVHTSFSHFAELPEIFSRGTIVNAEAHRHHSAAGLLAQRALYDPMVLARIDLGGRMTDGDVARLFEHRRRMMALTAAISSGFDALVMPTTPIVAPKFDDLSDPATFGKLNALALRNTSLFNFLDRCAISLPMHRGGGLPAGLMLVGEHLQDAQLLSVALAVEAVLGS